MAVWVGWLDHNDTETSRTDSC